jgi:hypothetical protein
MVLAWRADTKDGLAADTKDIFYSSDPGWDGRGGVANVEVGEEDRWGWGVVHSFYRAGDGGNITSLGGSRWWWRGKWYDTEMGASPRHWAAVATELGDGIIGVGATIFDRRRRSEALRPTRRWWCPRALGSSWAVDGLPLAEARSHEEEDLRGVTC